MKSSVLPGTENLGKQKYDFALNFGKTYLGFMSRRNQQDFMFL